MNKVDKAVSLCFLNLLFTEKRSSADQSRAEGRPPIKGNRGSKQSISDPGRRINMKEIIILATGIAAIGAMVYSQTRAYAERKRRAYVKRHAPNGKHAAEFMEIERMMPDVIFSDSIRQAIYGEN